MVDTHIDRIAKRLGLVKENAKYAEVQEAVKRFLPRDERTGGLFGFLQNTPVRRKTPNVKSAH